MTVYLIDLYKFDFQTLNSSFKPNQKSISWISIPKWYACSNNSVINDSDPSDHTSILRKLNEYLHWWYRWGLTISLISILFFALK